MKIITHSLRNFRYKGQAYQIIEASTQNGEPHARIEPEDSIFLGVLLAHIRERGSIVVEDCGYPERFQCFAGQKEAETKLLLEQRGIRPPE